jgi:KaiC/GvpD/RAD55 family RecA-like ATPase
MKGKQLAPLKLAEAKLVLQPSKKGVYQLKPKVHYLDELGHKNAIQLKTLEIKAKEVILADRLSTGTNELNSILLGGIPDGYAVALTGAPSKERKAIVNNFLQAGTREEQVTFYISSDLFGVKSLLEKPNFYFFLCNLKLKDQIPDLPNVYKLRSKTDLNNLGIALVKAYRSIDPSKKAQKRICANILSDVLVNYGVKSTRKWISELITNFGSKGFTMLAVFDAGMHPADETNAVLNLFDGEISIYEIVDEMKSRKALRIKKLGNQDYIENPICITTKR